LVTLRQSNFSVIILAAGVGRRLGQAEPAPKVLLDFAGESLIARHLALLAEAGAAHLTIVTGYMAERLEAAVAEAGPRLPVSFVHNPRFREGSVVSLAAAADALRSEAPVVLMDGDVLYDRRMHPRLLAASAENVLLCDRNIEPGDEPVKICFDANGTIVDFRKVPARPHVRHGESVGFFRFSPAMAARLADRARAYAADDRARLEYEEAIRDLILAEPHRFGAEDVTDLPWTEIDFPEDVAKARDEILPLLETA
jgi:choline kinase